MKIGIDCRMYGPKHTGIGRYVQNLVEELLKLDRENEYVLFVREDFLSQNSKLNPPAGGQNQNLKFKVIVADIPHYSLREQIEFPSIIAREKLDLMHFTHFNVPVFYRGKYVVTIHDLIKHLSKGRETTTRYLGIYWLKYLGYRIVFWLAVKRALRILVPSKTVKEELLKEYQLDSEKIKVTYEGVDVKLKVQSFDSAQDRSEKLEIKDVLEKRGVRKPFLLYVGSVYPHKNIERLIEAIRFLRSTVYRPQLVVVCARSVFGERLRKKIKEMKAEGLVNLAGFVPDEELVVLYREAEAFVFPSLSEGFGLPGLEAMSFGCPVICSDIPVLREIYQENAVYFDPYDCNNIAEKIRSLLDNKGLQVRLRETGPVYVKKYSWKKMAEETQEVYETI